MRIPLLPSLIILIIALGLNIYLTNNLYITAENELAKPNMGRVLGATARGEEKFQSLPDVHFPINADMALPPENISTAGYQVRSSSAVVLDRESGDLIYTQAAEEVVPIASITKLITALVFLNYNPGWEAVYQVASDDRQNGGRVYVYQGEKITVRDLFHISLVRSANTATRALVSSTGLSQAEFVQAMNRKMSALGLEKTHFVDPIGLSHQNVSTAAEVAWLVKYALGNKYIREAMARSSYEFKTETGRQGEVGTTNELLEKELPGISILGGKTGFIKAAGYCFTGLITNQAGHDIVTVVLGASTHRERFLETTKLAQWIYQNFEWR